MPAIHPETGRPPATCLAAEGVCKEGESDAEQRVSREAELEAAEEVGDGGGQVIEKGGLSHLDHASSRGKHVVNSKISWILKRQIKVHAGVCSFVLVIML